MSMKIAKEWFRSHPRTVVHAHWRMDKLSPASKERLAAPRSGAIVGHRVVFDGGVSELDLRNVDAEVAGNFLMLAFPGGGSATYRGEV